MMLPSCHIRLLCAKNGYAFCQNEIMRISMTTHERQNCTKADHGIQRFIIRLITCSQYVASFLISHAVRVPSAASLHCQAKSAPSPSDCVF